MGIRIISGSFRGRRLNVPRGMKTRPTTDRLRESLFNIISPRIIGAIVLDLFAGTGAFGLEALSRGADRCIFIEKSSDSLKVIKKNINLCGMEEKSEIIKWDILKNLSCIRGQGHLFDIVFMDPPYDRGMIKATLENLSKLDVLSNKGLIVVEHFQNEEIDKSINGYELSDQRRYKNTILSFIKSTKGGNI